MTRPTLRAWPPLMTRAKPKSKPRALHGAAQATMAMRVNRRSAAFMRANVRAKPLAAAGRLARAADDEPRRSHGQGALPWTVGA
jgi:hypothetical protein